MTGEPERFETIPLASAEECAGWAERVRRLERLWQRQSQQADSGFGSWTLGAASYIEGPRYGFKIYSGKAQLMNPTLRRQFGDLYDRVAAALESSLAKPVAYHEAFALPGFHIFRGPVGEASRHRDGQFRELEWSGFAHADLEHPLTFTLPIELPPGGGGLNYWPDLSEGDRPTEANRAYLPYAIGSLLVHSGLTLHQIASPGTTEPGDTRITLQGHGILCDGCWRLYW